MEGIPLKKHFAIVEIKADWKFHVELFSLWNNYWKSGAICHFCDAARIPRTGVVQSRYIYI